MKTRKVENGFFLCLRKDEKIIETLGKFVQEHGIGSGTLTGVGAVKNIKLGFYHLDRKKYDERFFTDDHELINLSGNVSWFNDKPVIHCHLTMGNTDFQAIAGHLFEAEIAVTGEIFLEVKDTRVTRAFDPEIGLNLQTL